MHVRLLFQAEAEETQIAHTHAYNSIYKRTIARHKNSEAEETCVCVCVCVCVVSNDLAYWLLHTTRIARKKKHVCV